MAFPPAEPMQRLAALFLIMAVTATADAATYRWVDDQGKVHYGDVIPSQESGVANVELDKQGRVKKENPRTRLSAEERRRLDADRAKREEAKLQEELQRRHDRSLLTTYVSESEIDLTRDRALDQEVANLRGLKARINAAADKLAYANSQINKYTKSGQSTPRAFIQMRDEAQLELTQLGELIRQREQAMADIKARFEADKLRFRELKASIPR